MPVGKKEKERENVGKAKSRNPKEFKNPEHFSKLKESRDPHDAGNPVKADRYTNLTFCFIPRKHCQYGKAGLLACNVFAVLPIPEFRDSGQLGQKPFALLTVAGQLVIYTQFPFNPGATRGPFPLDEEI